jgi:hypothetical protein
VVLINPPATLRAVRTITIHDPEFAGTYTVEVRSDELLVLKPTDGEPSETDLIASSGGRPPTPQPTKTEYGALPTAAER